MSWHIQPSDRLKALIDAHVGPAPCAPPDRGTKFSADHPYLQWVITRENILMKAVDEALGARKAEIEAKEMANHDRVELGEVPLTVLGHPCRWIEASCSLILHSYLGKVVLEEEFSTAK